MKALPDSYDEAKAYFTKLLKSSGNPIVQEVELKKWYKHRTTKQNNLLFALCTLIANIIDGHNLSQEDMYYALVEKYGPHMKNPIGEGTIAIRGSAMTTMEFTDVINGAFIELSHLDIPEKNQMDALDYWKDFIAFRYDQEEDPLNIKSITEYREKITSCEASGKFLGHYGEDDYCGQIAHIKSEGSGGTLTPDNVLHLHALVHVPDQHQHGWKTFVEKFPHLRNKVEKALGYKLDGTEQPEIEPESPLRSSVTYPEHELEIF